MKEFRRPHYWGHGGLPLNLEFLVRDLEEWFRDNVSWYEVPLALYRARNWMAEGRGLLGDRSGSKVQPSPKINHNLGVFGWDLRDALERTYDVCYEEMNEPKHQFIPNVENGNNLAAPG
jgi:hypothetical protein